MPCCSPFSVDTRELLADARLLQLIPEMATSYCWAVRPFVLSSFSYGRLLLTAQPVACLELRVQLYIVSV